MVGFRPPAPPQAPATWIPKPIDYRLKMANGGKDPHATHPADWSYGYRTPTCDCVGFVAWALGFDRYQVGKFPEYGGWINTDSMIAHAEASAVWFELIAAPEIGALVVTRSTYKSGKRIKVGHVGLVVDPLPAEWGGNWSDVRAIHCSSTNARRFGGAAIRETDARPWSRGGVFLRYLQGQRTTAE